MCYQAAVGFPFNSMSYTFVPPRLTQVDNHLFGLTSRAATVPPATGLCNICTKALTFPVAF